MVAQITPLSDPPSRADPENFVERSDQFMSELPVFALEANVLASEVNAKNQAAEGSVNAAALSADAAATSASNAAASESNAATSATNAAQSASDALELVEEYLGVQATDPTTGRGGVPLINGNWYINSASGFIRAYTTTGGWVAGVTAIAGVSALNGQTGALNVKTLHGVTTLGIGDLITYTATAVSKTLANMEHCTVTAATQTITLPATPAEGFECYISVGAFDDTVLARNGQTIMGVAEDMEIDKNLVTVTARFTNNTWRIV